ncbi:unnamed protein product, partial [marine sediment metagenome]
MIILPARVGDDDVEFAGLACQKLLELKAEAFELLFVQIRSLD